MLLIYLYLFKRLLSIVPVFNGCEFIDYMESLPLPKDISTKKLINYQTKNKY